MSAAPAVHAGHAHRRAVRIARIGHCFDYAFRAMWPWSHGAGLLPNWHHTANTVIAQQWVQAQADWHTAIAAGVDTTAHPPSTRPLFVIVNVPPGTAKSSCYTEALPCWWWVTHPEWQWLIGAHSLKNLAYEHHAKRRKILSHPAYAEVAREYGWEVTKSLIDEAKTSAGGWMKLVAGDGAGAGIGLHHHGHVYDDMSTPEDLKRPAKRATIEHTLTEALRDRFIHKPAAAAMLVMQRLTPDDPTAMLLADPRWANAARVVIPRTYDPSRFALPADHEHHLPESVDLGEPVEVVRRAFDGDRAWQGWRVQLEKAGFAINAGRLEWHDPRQTVGEQLNPRRYTAADEAADREAGTWDGPQDQRPTAKSAGIIQREWFDAADEAGGWRRLPDGLPGEVGIAGDTQDPDQRRVVQPDWTVLLVGARYGGHMYLVERVRARMGGTILNAVLWLLWCRHGRRRVREVLEASNAGRGAADRLHGLGPVVTTVKADRGKVQRLTDAAPMVRTGRVHLPHRDAERPPWLPPDEPWPLLEIDPADPRLPEQLRPAPGAPPPAPIEVLPPHRWVPGFRGEVCKVGPGSSGHDDQADALSLLLLDAEPRMGFQPTSTPSFALPSAAPKRAPLILR